MADWTKISTLTWVCKPRPLLHGNCKGSAQNYLGKSEVDLVVEINLVRELVDFHVRKNNRRKTGLGR